MYTNVNITGISIGQSGVIDMNFVMDADNWFYLMLIRNPYWWKAYSESITSQRVSL